MSDDFPTFGIPTIAKCIPFLFFSIDLISLRFNSFKIVSKRSPVNLPFSAETGTMGFIANS